VDPEQARHIVARFDGLLLTGGGDVDPARYGQDRHPEVAGVSPSRDAFELALTPAAVRAGLPILAVCRGMQVLNVALGGTLHQHLEDLDHVHRGPDRGWSSHPVRLEEGSLVAGATGRTRVDCSASHHQAVDRLAGSLRAVGWADDGVVEAAELEDGWVVAVQWHPERTADSDPAQQGLFDALAERARLRPAERPA
jgi:putative glutamine amidotransferase